MTQILEWAGWIVALGTAITFLYKLYKLFKGKVDALECTFNAQTEALKCLLRNSITSTYYKHIEDKTIREYEFEAMLQEAETYFALGGNSYVKKLHDDMCGWKVIS